MASVLAAEREVCAHTDGTGGDRARAAPQGAAVVCLAPVSFEAVYREHFRFVWRTARRLGIEPPYVDDVVQETFVVVHRRLKDFGQRSTVRTWLYGIVRRVVADHRRGLRRKRAHGEDATGYSADEAGSASGRTPEASIERAERVRLLQRLLDELDYDKREVFILAELEEMTLAEIAEALGANANTVASRLRAARREFERALERAGERRAPSPPRSAAESVR
jgi:RNA polymerase sigma-70 factor (ECF subfamily)